MINNLKNLIKTKKGNIQAGMMTLIVGAIMLVVAAFVLSSGSSVLNTQATTQITGAANCNSTSVSACGYAYNSSGFGLQGLNTVAQQQPSIGSIVVLAAIVVILFGVIGYFAFRK